MSRQVVVIGGGVIGLCTAFYAARKGHRVTVIDRQPAGYEGCSYGNAGMIVPSHFVPLAAPGAVLLGIKWMWNPRSPFYIKPRLDLDLLAWGWNFWRASTARRVSRAAPLLRDLHLASRASFEELSASLRNDFGLVQNGLLMLCKTERALEEEAKYAALAEELGVPAKVLGAKETSALDPAVRMSVAGSVYFPKDCHLSPARFMAGLKRQLGTMGVRFFWNHEVIDWRITSDRICAVQTSQDEVPADEFVLCGGAWSGSVGRDLQLRLPMQAGKGYSLTLTAPRTRPRICAIFNEARVAVTPMGDHLRFGGTMEMAGLNERITPGRVEGIIESVPAYYPDFQAADFAGIVPWCGLRPCSPDGLPYLGRTAKYRNLSIATGHAMMGLSLAPVTGKLISEILGGEKPSLNIDLLNPDRYA